MPIVDLVRGLLLLLGAYAARQVLHRGVREAASSRVCILHEGGRC